METKELEKLSKEYELVWDKLEDDDLKQVFAFSERYKAFMDLVFLRQSLPFSMLDIVVHRGAHKYLRI